VANRARPFAISIPIGAKPKVWKASMKTRRRSVTYIWYRAVGSEACMILPSGTRPPEGWDGENVELHPDLETWKEAIAKGYQANNSDELYKEIKAREKLEALEQRVARAEAVRSDTDTTGEGNPHTRGKRTPPTPPS